MGHEFFVVNSSVMQCHVGCSLHFSFEFGDCSYFQKVGKVAVRLHGITPLKAVFFSSTESIHLVCIRDEAA